jgi:nitrate reductase assembly molybdenum cofactor insertion protein NarJ
MPATVHLHDLVADLLRYPGPGQGRRVAEAAREAARELPGAAGRLRALAELAEAAPAGILEESYTAAFDNTAERALEVGWHAFGENYTRGAFLVRMRERLRETGVPETTELPDHLTHVLRVLARIDARDARLLSDAIVLPAVEKVLSATAPSDPWRGPLEAAAIVLRTHAGAPEVAHA